MARQSKKKSKAKVKKPRDGTINININAPSAPRTPKSSATGMRISGGRATGGGTGRAPNQAATLNALREQAFLQALQNATRQGITNPKEIEDLKKQIKELEGDLRKFKKMEEIRAAEGPLSGPTSGVGFSEITSEPSIRSYAFQESPQRAVENWRRSVSTTPNLTMSVRPPEIEMLDINPRRPPLGDVEQAPIENPMKRLRPVIKLNDPRNPFEASESPF